MSEKKMLKLDDSSCSVCKNDFFKKDLDEHGRCVECKRKGIMPGFKPEQDYIQDEQAEYNKLKAMVKQIIEELQNEGEVPVVEVNENTSFEPKICKECGEEFIPRAPAQKRCPTCLEIAKQNAK